MFYHAVGVTSEGDGKCPVGLFGQDLSKLMKCVDHTSGPRTGNTGWGKHGMIYWAHKDLILLATCNQVEAAQPMKLAS